MTLRFVFQQLVVFQCKSDSRIVLISLRLQSTVMSLLKKTKYYVIPGTFYVLRKHILAYEQLGSLIY